MKKTMILLTMVMAVISGHLQAQAVVKGFEVAEFYKISQAYATATHVSFDMRFRYADSAKPAIVLEELQGNYKMQNGHVRGLIDSIEYLRGYLYTLVISYPDSVITVGESPKDQALLQLPLMDSLFRAANIDSMYTKDVSDSNRQLVVNFKPGGTYGNYTVNYNPVTYMIQGVRYLAHSAAGNDNDGGSGTSIISIDFSNYRFDTIDENFFNEFKYIDRKGQNLVLKEPYTGFRLIVQESSN